jgi:hypothetical protein
MRGRRPEADPHLTFHGFWARPDPSLIWTRKPLDTRTGMSLV